MPLVHAYRPDGIACLVEFDDLRAIPPTFRSWPADPACWQDGLVPRIACRVHEIWQGDPGHPWHGTEHSYFGEIFHDRTLNRCYCSMARGLGPMEFCLFELIPDEVSAWFLAERIENPSPTPEAATPSIPPAPSGAELPSDRVSGEIEPPPKKTPLARDQGKSKRCLGIYMDSIRRNEVPPTASEIARQAGCSVATASRAVRAWEAMRLEGAKGARRAAEQ
jgi:hypothetical protein